ncbi:hypothetical protein BDZ91DRAFT_728964, partial [Kalaharituber pfeilii]
MRVARCTFTQRKQFYETAYNYLFILLLLQISASCPPQRNRSVNRKLSRQITRQVTRM